MSEYTFANGRDYVLCTSDRVVIKIDNQILAINKESVEELYTKLGECLLKRKVIEIEGEVYIYKGKIVSFHGIHGVWQSGLAVLTIEDYDRGRVSLPCNNATTARALDDAFGGVMIDEQTVSQRVIKGKEIYYFTDAMGLVLGGFIPAEQATEEVIKAYERTKQEISQSGDNDGGERELSDI